MSRSRQLAIAYCGFAGYFAVWSARADTWAFMMPCVVCVVVAVVMWRADFA